MIQTKPLSQEIPILAFLSDSEFLTRGGDVGTVLVASPRDVECSEQRDINEIAERLTKAWRIVDPQYRVYQYWIRRKGDRGLYVNEMYLALVGINGEWDDKPSLFPSRSVQDIRRGLEQRRAYLSQKLKSWLEQTGDIWPMRVSTQKEAYGLFWRLVNYDSAKVPPLLESGNLNQQIVDSEIDWGASKVGNRHIAVLSLRHVPDEKKTVPYMLECLSAMEADFTLCVQSQGVPLDKQKDYLKTAKRTQEEAEKGVGGILKEGETGRKIEDRHLDPEAVANSDALRKAHLEVVEGNRLCLFGLSIVVHAESKEELDSSTESIKSAMDMSVRMVGEGVRDRIVFFSMFPGNHDLAHFRKKSISEASVADFSTIFGTDSGNPRNENLNAPAVCVFETEQRTPYHYNWPVHLSIFGRTGTGKSVLVNRLLMESWGKYRGYVSITDLGGSFEFLTKECGGSFSRIVAGSSNKTGWNPLGWPNSDEQRRFVVSLLTMLIERRGSSLDDDQVEDINQAVVQFYDSDKPKVMRYLVPFLPEGMQRPMRRWHSNGLDAWLLDNDVQDCRLDSDFQTDEWIGFTREEFEYLLEPMFLCKFRFDLARLMDQKRLGQLKLVVFDEAWAAVKSKRSASYLRWALKMLRRYNAVVVMATQSEKDLSETSLMPVINECCDKIFTAIPGMKSGDYATTFELQPKQLETIKTLVPKRQLFVCNAGMSGKVLNNVLTEDEKLRYATDADTVARRNDAVQKFGENWIQHMHAGRNGKGSGNGAHREHVEDADSRDIRASSLYDVRKSSVV